MKSVEYSQFVKRKFLKLKKKLIGEYGEEKTKEILTAIANVKQNFTSWGCGQNLGPD